jgi:hypothetical protein
MIPAFETAPILADVMFIAQLWRYMIIHIQFRLPRAAARELLIQEERR